MATSPAARLWAKVEQRGPDECWPWLGAKNEQGYGMLGAKRDDGRRTTVRVHRVAYEASIGAIPDGLEIDHICHSWSNTCTAGPSCPHRSCCNPAHMRVVTRAVNEARKRWRERTHCPRGHPYTPENTKIGSKGEKKCRTCHRERERARAARRKA